MRPDAVGELMAAASRRAGLDVAIRAHQLRHACGSNIADAGAGIDVVADLLGHASVSSSQVYVHPDPSRLLSVIDLAHGGDVGGEAGLGVKQPRSGGSSGAVVVRVSGR